jgi:16S rRNA (guanine527-N7)-methyltransferase
MELLPGLRAAIDAQVRLLVAWNEHINLTALRTPERVARGHVLDSLAALPLLRRLAAAGAGRRHGRPPNLLDLGSGAGFPGLPLALALPAARCALVDSVAKKASFLEVAAMAADEAMRAAGAKPPRLEVLAQRAEDLADEPAQRAGWHLVTARAVGALSEVAELALPLLEIGGHLACWKHDDGSGALASEVASAARVIQAAGGTRARIESVPLADRLGLAGHVLVIVRKTRPTPDRYPRSPAERRRAALT